MAWLNSPVTGTNSVSANKAPINANHNYIAATMVVDHFWDDLPVAGVDGHHQFVAGPGYETGGSPADPALPASCDFIFWAREITKDDTTTENLPFMKNSEGHEFLLGVRAALNFSVTSPNTGGATPVIEWQYNISSIMRDSQGKFTINYTNNMPNRNYIPAGNAYTTGNPLTLHVLSQASYNTNVDPSFIKVEFVDNNNTAFDPERGMILIMGG